MTATPLLYIALKIREAGKAGRQVDTAENGAARDRGTKGGAARGTGTGGTGSGGLSEGRCLLCHHAWAHQTAVLESTCPNCGARLDTRVSDPILPSGSRLQGGLYVLQSCIGKGGFGITYTALTPSHGPAGPTTQLVAVKELFHGDDTWRDAAGRVNFVGPDRDTAQSALRKFQREIEALARVRHPNIVHILRSFVENGTAYFVMEYVEGITLKQRLRDLSGRGQKMPEPEVRRIVGEVVEALGALHRAHLTHLDIKPANIMLARDGRVILIDFGAVRIAGSDHTTVGVGSVGYAPLEVLAGDSVGPESDIYELGVVLHEMLTGTMPPQPSQRKHGWRADHLSPPWRALVETALTIRQESRPKDILRWWNGANWEAWEKALRARGEDPERTKKLPREAMAALWNASGGGRSVTEGRAEATHVQTGRPHGVSITTDKHRSTTASQRIRETWNGWPLVARGAFTLSIVTLIGLLAALFARPHPVTADAPASPSATSARAAP
jgi:serine/threonine protein kinase